MSFLGCKLEGRASESADQAGKSNRWLTISDSKARPSIFFANSCFFFSWGRSGAWGRFFGELVAGPEDAACEEVEVNILLHGLVVMTERGAKHTSLAVGVCPGAEVILLGVLAIRLAKPLGVGPDFSILYSSPFGVSHLAGNVFMMGCFGARFSTVTARCPSWL